MLACAAAIALVGWMHFGGGTGQARAGQPGAGTQPAGVAGAWREWLSFPGYRDVVPVLMYHSIGGRPSYPLAIPGRFSPRLSYRMSLGPEDTLPVFRCRLSEFVHRLPIAAERRCARLSPVP